jgi:hypothetical protein
MRKGPSSDGDFHVLYKFGWNAAVKAIAAACDEQINRNSMRMDRGAVYAEVATHIRSLEKSLDENTVA